MTRYATIKQTIDEVLAGNEMAAAMKPQLEAAVNADLSGVTREQREQHAARFAQMRAAWEAPYARLPAEVATALKAREAELSRLRADALASAWAR